MPDVDGSYYADASTAASIATITAAMATAEDARFDAAATATALTPQAVADHTLVSHAAGLIVLNTTTGVTYRSNGSTWTVVTGPAGSPFAVAAGTVTFPNSGAATASVAVTFPASRFTVAPIIIATPTQGTALLTITSSATTTSGATLYIRRVDAAVIGAAYDASWYAVQMTSTTATG